MILIETLASVFGAGIRCWESILAELYGRKGYRCVEWWLKMYSCGRLLSVLQKDLAVFNTLERYMGICRNVGYMDIYVLLRSRRIALKRFEVKSTIYAGLFLQDVRLGQMEIAINF